VAPAPERVTPTDLLLLSLLPLQEKNAKLIRRNHSVFFIIDLKILSRLQKYNTYVTKLLQKYDIIIKFKNLNPESGSMDVKKCNPKAIYSLIVSSIGKCEFPGKFLSRFF